MTENRTGAGSLNGDVKIGVYICHCGSNIGGKVDVPAVVEYAAALSHVAVARD
jgi:heterodisulfide reductase subunit A